MNTSATPVLPRDPHLSYHSVVDIENFSLWYNKTHQALYDINLRIPAGQVTAMIGPSGCGKSTLLRSINRLNDLTPNIRIEGAMNLNGSPIYGRYVDVISLRKRLGMVFQKSNPFPMSIFENVVYSQRLAGVRDKKKLHEVAESALRSAALWDEVKDRLHANAAGMSGGQQQRLCIARAVAADPEVLLMDEPCSALDPIATSRVEELINNLRGKYTVIIVTHNMQQATRVADYTAFMYMGKLAEFDKTEVIFNKPANKLTEQYITGRFG